jgi:HlyD family secretion protein
MYPLLDAPASQAPRKSLHDFLEKEKERKHWRRLKYWTGLLALAVVITAAIFLLQPKAPSMLALYRTQHVMPGVLVREIRATGRVEAITTVQIGAEISGRVSEILVDYNDTVKSGQILARFDRQALLAQSAQAAALLAAARASLEQSKTDRVRATRDAKRAAQLHAQGNIADAKYDDAVSSAQLAAQRVTAGEAQVAAQIAAYNVALTNLDHTTIVSPINGVIISRNIDPGQTVASVLQTPVLFTVAADLRKMRVVASVDEADIADAAMGQKASFSVNAYPDRIFEGHVTEVRNSPIIVQDVVTYGTVVEVDNLDLALKPGMTASVRIRVATAISAFSVPNAALRFTPPGQPQGGTAGVWIIDAGSLKRIPVRSGISDGESTEISAGDVPSEANIVVDLSPEGRKHHERRR